MAAAIAPGIFTSVFPVKDHTTPTPEATPNIGTLASPGAAFGGFDISNDAAEQAARLNRSWSIATRFLTLSAGLNEQRRQGVESSDVVGALDFLLGSSATQKDIFSWYMHEISNHFRFFVLPELSFWQQPIHMDKTREVFSKTVQILQQAQNLYLPFVDQRKNSRPLTNDLQSFRARTKRDFHTLVWNTLPSKRVQKALASYLFEMMKTSLDHSSNPEKCLKYDHCRCHLELDLDALMELREIGLGGNVGQLAFAHAVYKFLQGPAIERRCFQVDWNRQISVTTKLCAWIENQFLPSVQQALTTLTNDATFHVPAQQFTSAAVSSFGRQRVSALFDYVNTWPASEGAVLDIREYISANGAGEKLQLCSCFTDQMQQRLLHAGASTTEILSFYINVIRVFKLLDTRGVLLEKVAIPIRSYLRNREDTVSVIAASFLAEVGEKGEVHSHDTEKICSDIAVEVANSAVDAQDDRLLNWDDMEWVPDPIDAGPNYKSSKSDDVVAYVLALFETDDFIKALAAALGDHLIHTTDTQLAKELRLIELLKSRLDATKLQQAEVMLKDMRDSIILNRRINPAQHGPRPVAKPTPKDVQAAIPEEGITVVSLWNKFRGRLERTELHAMLVLVSRRRNGLYFPKRTRLAAQSVQAPAVAAQGAGVQFEAKIVSGYFWPQLRDFDFQIPAQVRQMMAQYEQSFTAISGQRKLAWKHGAGTVDVKLELEDRTVEENQVEEWKASLIDYFGSPDYDDTAGATIADLTSSLQMEEEFVLGALSFWIAKRVLYEMSPGSFAVLERLDMEVEALDDASHIDLEALAAGNSETNMLRDNAVMYQNFIEGMLRNQGAKEVGGMMGITGMLKMVLQDFNYGDEDVKWLLEDMASQGKVKKNGSGDLWSIV